MTQWKAIISEKAQKNGMITLWMENGLDIDLPVFPLKGESFTKSMVEKSPSSS